ncbi:MAG: MarR family winged helix-turn-helix transcriptional regulator [Christensenellales bacterium]
MSFHDVSRRFVKLHLLMRIVMMKNISNMGLYYGQFPILEFIRSKPKCTQQEIAQMLEVSPASIALSTKRLQKCGFIKKETNEINLRRNMLTLTQKGVDTAEKCRQAYDAADTILYSGFAEEDLESLRNLLDRMIANIEKKDEKIFKCLFDVNESEKC